MRGIYKITIPNTGLVYIGSSTDIEKRFGEHWGSLNVGNHHSYKLQNDFNKMKDRFALEFGILEECDKNVDLVQRESEWIKRYDSIRNGYNVVNCMDDFNCSESINPIQRTVHISRGQIEILNNEKYNRPYSGYHDLSCGWFSDYRNIEKQRGLMLHIQNLFKNVFAGRRFFWTTHKYFQPLLSSKGSKGRYLAMDSYEEHDAHVLAFAANIFLPVGSKNIVLSGMDTTNDTYALHRLLTWLWLSPLRYGDKVTLYLPSKRMRNLLQKWITEVSE